ncbi:tryptophan--tRNA ligase [Sandaracinus amylolyticus]|uniref:Tryptophan--tRNA ligase n=1 Tax=Sandaracinus amylolyticus TaxID=927083 RepID=A0A0F6W7Y5_9BACT|nr:tryptophan--tRNA ligase [Sandaracinus amylolyticus]AKF09787.1 Tryptophanyl-tRNA synthetase [Sandaracinus amylolyticus]
MDSKRKISLTGIKPTHVPHIGNYFGAIRPALRLTESYDGMYFIADYHALTTVRDPKALQQAVYDVTATWLACGLDPKSTIVYRQSSVPEVFELAWVLSCVVATGQLERGHAYKDAVAKGDVPNAGVFYYPVLMAADILLYGAQVVPIGQDQKQHLELARDMAQRLNHHYGEGTVVVPEALITEAPLVPGFDGHKMSKSRGNGITVFAPAKELRKGVMKFVTGSESLEEPKDPEGATVFQLYKLVATNEEIETLASKLRAGGYGWGHAKQDLYEALERELGPFRERFDALRADEAALDRTLEEGAERARAIARRTVARVRAAVGIDRPA